MTATGRQVRTVVVQDRSRLYRECLHLLLPPFSVARAVEDGEGLVAACGDDGPDAVVFEAVGVPWDVGDLARRLRHCAGPVLVGTYPPDRRRLPALDGVAFVGRDASAQALHDALAGSAVASAEGRGSPRRSDRSRAAPEDLTRRELQVLALIGRGLTTAQIADRLGISAKTVENRRQILFTRLGVQNQSHAVAVAMRSGLLGVTAGSPEPS